MPLTIDLQQILLHWLNFAILTGGLYFLLYKPVTQLMSKREDYYRNLDQQAKEKLAQAQEKLAQAQAKLDSADEEIRQARIKSQQASQQAAEEQLNQAREWAEQIMLHARTEAEHDREEILRSSQRELRNLAAAATRKLALGKDPFDQFLDLAEGGSKHEDR